VTPRERSLATRAPGSSHGTRRSGQRPLLRNPDPLGTLERLTALRAPLYEETADLTVDTDGRRVKAVVDDIARRLEEARGA
jgi:shikimate kinase